jgi:glutathione S-transferase
MVERPILYSFRRCPYAIRARLALAAAGVQPGLDLELREVNLKARPSELLEASAKGTVPVLVLPADGTSAGQSHGASSVIDQSLAVMRWALERHDPGDLLRRADRPGHSAQRALIEALIASNDGPFKHHLDRFKYAGRHPGADPEEHRAAALTILRDWNARLPQLVDRASLADLALLPFVRQFRLADPERFDAAPGLKAVQAWLGRFLASPELSAVMTPPWAAREAWRSPRWLYHLALAPEWHAARSEGIYRRSSRGLSLEEVGFIHASHSHQLEATHQRFYADAPDVLLLTIDPGRLAAAGIAVEEEPAPGSGELFPHIQGPLPLAAVLAWEPFRP